ncbi:MAG: hypothetical protein JWO14_1571 [Solirubrobacterales bacterium]|nr:hypothetical protein [Solirubrobacterales bacterium]
MGLFGDKTQDQDSGTGVEGEVERLSALPLPELADSPASNDVRTGGSA